MNKRFMVGLGAFFICIVIIIIVVDATIKRSKRRKQRQLLRFSTNPNSNTEEQLRDELLAFSTNSNSKEQLQQELLPFFNNSNSKEQIQQFFSPYSNSQQQVRIPYYSENNIIDKEKKNISKQIPLVLYINLDKSKKRNASMQRGLNSIYFNDTREIVRVPGVVAGAKKNKLLKNAVCLSREVVGCTLAHYRCIQIAIEKNVDYALILEDDADFSLVPYWPFCIPDIVEAAPKDWSTIRLFYFGMGDSLNSYMQTTTKSPGDIVKKNNEYTSAAYTSSAAAYLISKQGMHEWKKHSQNFTSTMFGKCQAIDNITFEFDEQKHLFNYSVTIPYFFPAFQLSMHSNITNENVHYMEKETQVALRHAFLSPMYIFHKPIHLKRNDDSAYRLGDAVYNIDNPNVNYSLDCVVKNYPGSLAAKYLFLSKGETGRLDILHKLVKNHKLHIERYLENKDGCVTIHLRLGDVLEMSDASVKDHLLDNISFTTPDANYTNQYVFPFSYFENILTTRFPVKKYPTIELVTGTHLPGLGTKKTEEYISTLRSWITDRLGYTCVVPEMLGFDADIDFLYMCHASNFVPTGGGFSKLVQEMRMFSATV